LRQKKKKESKEKGTRDQDGVAFYIGIYVWYLLGGVMVFLRYNYFKVQITSLKTKNIYLLCGFHKKKKSKSFSNQTL
jgi:hypothetical protein